MGRGKNLDRLRDLDDDVLAEIVREGEAMLAAQFTAANASDQRAMTWAGFVITVATVSVGATASIVLTKPDAALATIAALFSALLTLAAFIAIRCVRPRKFALPGNRPENWLPSEWEAGRKRDLRQARVEQARCLNNQIDDNAKWAEQTAGWLNESMGLTAVSVLLASVYVAGVALFRFAAT